MTYIRRDLSNEQRQALSKRSYELHLTGLDAPSIAEQLHLEVFQVESMITWWAENRIATPQQEQAAKYHISRLEAGMAEITGWQNYLEESKRYGKPHLVAATAAALAKVKLDYAKEWASKMGLDVPVTLNIHNTTPVDDAVMQLVAEHGAAAEADAPLVD